MKVRVSQPNWEISFSGLFPFSINSIFFIDIIEILDWKCGTVKKYKSGYKTTNKIIIMENPHQGIFYPFFPTTGVTTSLTN